MLTDPAPASRVFGPYTMPDGLKNFARVGNLSLSNAAPTHSTYRRIRMAKPLHPIGPDATMLRDK